MTSLKGKWFATFLWDDNLNKDNKIKCMRMNVTIKGELGTSADIGFNETINNGFNRKNLNYTSTYIID